VAHIGDIADIANLVANELKVSVHYIESEESANVSEVYIAIDSRSTDVHPYHARHDGFEYFFFSRNAVVNDELLVHGAKIGKKGVWGIGVGVGVGVGIGDRG
jgi:hypothetical protein